MASKIALGITIIVLAATCYFGFATRGKIQGLDDQLAAMTQKWHSTESELTATQGKLKAAQDELAKTKDELQSTQAQLATTQSNLDAANTKITDLNNQIDTLKKQIAVGPNPPVPVPNAGAISQQDYDKVKGQLSDAQAQVAELNQVKETLTNKLKDAESRADDLQKVVDHYKDHVIKNGLEGTVLAYNPGWNFVVLSIGDRQGAVVNGEMIVKRNGNQIGKVKITSVDPATSVADVEPGSVPRGVRIQPGDTVIYQTNED
ncbi:MAG TPA: hypothetical protein VHY22_14195 [Chthoniobacteraceae bacterium]|jgi:outer membrane murein-binding lipoprotein Lpp|nr:hypothetical protein [Chthoniobacteraceae bacterium]